mmetsp:Transcript_27576/g.69837  ORF Transcript_27576/g.69837 Transcript_27576/m.69837 type:complete len:121 (+) Transcript_27576:360-722(+)
MVTQDGVANFEGCNIHDNTASECGGGVYICQQGGVANCEGCNFHRNTANQGGGICLMGAATATLTNTNVSSNTATDKGPNALVLHSNGQLTVSYSADLTWVEGPVTVLPAAPPAPPLPAK